MRHARWPKAGAALATGGVAVGVALGFSLSDYYLFLATSAVTAAIVARSVGLVTGQAGMITLCQMGFAAIGAYVVTGLTASTGIPFLVQVALGTLAGAPFGLAVGLPALRIRGINLAVVTLGFAVALDIFISRQDFPGVQAGSGVLPSAPFDTARGYYLFSLACFVLVCAALGIVSRGRTGAGWLAVRHSERATAALGLSVTVTKLQAFALSAMVASLGGALIAGQLQLPTPDTFNPLTSLVAFAVAVMFAARYPEGAILAGGIGVVLQEVFRRLGIPLDYADLFFGVGVVDVLRRGRGGVADQMRSALSGKGRRKRAGEEGGLAPMQPGRPRPATRQASTRPALETAGLTVRYGALLAVENLDLVVPAGAIVALIGPNGAGKSSVIDAVSGFIPYTGEVRVAGQAIDGRSARRRARTGIRRTFQQDRTIPDLTVARYLDLAAGRSLSSDEVGDVLSFVGGVAPRDAIGQLDVGTRRLVEVAGVLAARPIVALLDEPAAGLAPNESRQLAERVTEIPERFGAAVLLVDHDMEYIQVAAPTATVMDFGRVIAHGPTAEVLKDAAVIAAYLGAEASAA
jgi:branched-chain amino acid transport system permease protein